MSICQYNNCTVGCYTSIDLHVADSDVGCVTGHPVRGYVWFSSVFKGECLDSNTFEKATPFCFEIRTYSH